MTLFLLQISWLVALSPGWPDTTTPTDDKLILVEAEAFDSYGSWVLDQQFMDLMGSPFLLAHGMGTPVENAVTNINVPQPGNYRVWVRTRDWVAPWKVKGAPGKFQLLVNGKPLTTTFGTENAKWHWQDGGEIRLTKQTELQLQDLTGFEGRCDAVLFCRDSNFVPPVDLEDLTSFRRKTLGIPEEPIDRGKFDLVVVGGGVAGTAAAITAARKGLKVALVQDRPVLGGNSSSEVRVWPEGHVNQKPYYRIGDVVMEIIPTRTNQSRNAQAAKIFNDQRKLDLVKSEPNITLFLEHRMNEAFGNNQSIQSVVCQSIRNGHRVRLRGDYFLDSTGDGSVGFLVGADFDQTDKGHMGASNLWNIKCLCQDEDPLSTELQAACEQATFPRCPWAVDLADKPFPGRDSGPKQAQPDANGNPISLGNWFWESGFDRDPINDMERIRDQNFRAVYGAWDTIKNVEQRYPAHRLNWVAYIAGKRESRRLLGDVVLTGSHLREGKDFVDGCFPCTWGIDTHFPDPRYSKGHDGDEFIADYTRGKGFEYKRPYWVPYRCLYSRNINNLFMAGRNISVTHEALGAVRVMKTTGTMGEIVGLAASICKDHQCNPRDVFAFHWPEMQEKMRRGAGRRKIRQPNSDQVILLLAKDASVRGKQLKYESDQDCLGYWRNKNDFPEWSFATDKTGQYQVELELACPENESNHQLEIRMDDRSVLTTAVSATQGWEDFVVQAAGRIELPSGQTHTMTLHSRKANGPLMKLRTVRLKLIE